MLGIALASGLPSAWATYSLPADRSVVWQGNVGVLNDIPARTTICTTLSPSGGDDTATIKAAIESCKSSGNVVKLNAGTFNVTPPLALPYGITLRGAGMGKTILKGAGTTSIYFLKIGPASNSLGSSVNISGGLSKGSRTIITASAHGWAAGDLILIDQLNNPNASPPVDNFGSNNAACTWCGRSSGTRSLGQIVKVVGIPSSTTATLEIPLYWNYSSSLTPQATKIVGVLEGAGVESMTLDNMQSGNANQVDNYGTVVMRGTSNSWLLDVEVLGSHQTALKLFTTYRNTVRGCKLHEPSASAPSGVGIYGIYFNPYASANLIENNQIYHLTTGMMMNGATSGNVISYNYITDLYNSGAANWNLSAIGAHGAHPIMNLIEGNYTTGRLRADEVWGTSSHQVYFRNRQRLQPGQINGPWNMDVHSRQHFHSFIGNVIGTPGVERAYELQNASISLSQSSIYRFGYNSDGDTSPTSNDPGVLATALRHNNWDSVNNGAVPNAGSDPVLPASLYLTAKPAWMSAAVQWPPIGPDVSPMYPAAPALGTGTPFGSGTAPMPASGLAIVAGGTSYTDSSGFTYGDDANFSGGTTAFSSDPISGTEDDYLYKAERYGDFSYNFPVPNGAYNVTLKMAENYWTAAGQRIFNINVNGASAAANLDIFAKVGANTAYDLIVPVTVTNGTIEIDFISLVDNAKVSAIRIDPATSPGPTPTPTSTPTATPAPTGFTAVAGGSSFTDSTGIAYQADSRFVGGSTASTTAAISGTVDDYLYQHERFGNFYYDIPVANGTYSIVLKFAEIYWTAAGRRVFNVLVNGTTAISNLDIFAKVGINTAYDVVLPVTVTNGMIKIQFVTVADNAKVSAIQIVPGTVSPTPTPTQTPINSFIINSSAGSGGTISPSGSVSVAAGASQTFTIKPLKKYSIENVVVDGISKGAVSSYTFSNVTANHTISVTFRR